MKLADKGLNTQAQAIEEAQTEIRIAVRDGWLYGRGKAIINAQVQKIILKAAKSIKLSVLREAAFRSLNAFAERQYNTYMRRFGSNSSLLLALLTLGDEKATALQRAQAEQTVRQAKGIFRAEELETDAKGVPNQIYAADYFKRYVEPAFSEILKQKALDPDDVSGSNSLRNRAEMEVRYNSHIEQIEELRAAGIKLVTCSVHADCSDRCYKWQGRVYSLDGTSGTTEDGKPYVPLERATDIFYTTKAGITYKNGLLGFNCRHYLMPYKAGMMIPHVSKATQRKENAINTRQRELERIVREYKEKALIYKPFNTALYKAARAKAIEWRNEYIKFSKDNGRAYYPSRIELL